MKALVTVEAPQDLIDGGGATRRSFAVIGQVWAQIRPVRQFLRVEAGRPSGVVSHMLTFRSMPGFSCDWRLRLADRLFLVLSFDEGDEAMGFMRACCEEVRP
jgi:head-tail adaptor